MTSAKNPRRKQIQRSEERKAISIPEGTKNQIRSNESVNAMQMKVKEGRENWSPLGTREEKVKTRRGGRKPVPHL
jgi:hypothetical protein